jgi:hypothetical protein
MPELPPIEAYGDIGEVRAGAHPAADEPSEEVLHGVTPSPTGISFAPENSPFWRINDGCDWIERDLPQRQWIVPQYLMKRKVTALIGAPEAGKSSMALKWGIALALDCRSAISSLCHSPVRRTVRGVSPSSMLRTTRKSSSAASAP